MPKYTDNLLMFFRANQIDTFAFAYVRGMMKVLPTITLEKTYYEFIKDFDIDTEELSFEDYRNAYYRQQKKFFNKV